MPQPKTPPLKEASREIKKLIVEMGYRTRTNHVGSSLSISDILAVLYWQVLKHRPSDPDWPGRDYFILSKGHAAAALYATLAVRGYFPRADLAHYRTNGGLLHAHPSRGSVPGIEVSTGSLGHGLSIGAGLALAAALNRRPNHTYVLLGDGECDEGSVWEAAKHIGAQQLANITAIVDWNNFQGFALTHQTAPAQFAVAWQALGWRVETVSGHDQQALEAALVRARTVGAPSLVLAETISGKGLPEAENSLLAHYYIIPDEARYRAIIDALDHEK